MPPINLNIKYKIPDFVKKTQNNTERTSNKKPSKQEIKNANFEQREEWLKQGYMLVSKKQIEYAILKDSIFLYGQKLLPKEAVWNPKKFYESDNLRKPESHLEEKIHNADQGIYPIKKLKTFFSSLLKYSKNLYLKNYQNLIK
ncbi:hypothetical protein ACFLZF_00355 [Nanoarchaeota archaeon]